MRCVKSILVDKICPSTTNRAQKNWPSKGLFLQYVIQFDIWKAALIYFSVIYNTKLKYSWTSHKQTPLGTRKSDRLREVSAYGSGVSIKAGYQRSIAAYKASYRCLLRPREKGHYSPFSGHSRPLYHQQPRMEKVIETPAVGTCRMCLYMYVCSVCMCLLTRGVRQREVSVSGGLIWYCIIDRVVCLLDWKQLFFLVV